MAIVLHAAALAATAYGAGTINYFTPACAGLISNTTESNCQITYRTAGVMANLYVRVTANAATGAGTLVTRIGGVNGGQSASITASTTGEFQDAVHSDSIVAGNQLSYQLTVGSGGSTTITIINTTFAATSGTVCRLAVTGAASPGTAGTTRFYGVAGFNNFQSTEANAQFKCETAGTLQNFFLLITVNGNANAATFGTRVGGVNGHLSVSVTASVTGIYEDIFLNTADSDTIAAGTLINYFDTLGSGTVSITSQVIGVEILTSTGNSLLVGSSNGNTQNPGSTLFYPLAGAAGGTSAGAAGIPTETNVQMPAQSVLTFTNLAMWVTNNTTGASTFNFRKNGLSGNQSVAISSSSSGYFEDGAGIDVVGPSDELNLQLITGAGGTFLGFFIYGLMAQASIGPPPIIQIPDCPTIVIRYQDYIY